MSKRTQNEIIFDLIAEEIFPPSVKAEPTPRVEGTLRSNEYRPSLSAPPIQQRPLPLRSLVATLQVDSEVLVQKDSREIEIYIRESIARQLARELMPLLEIEKTYNAEKAAVRYYSRIYVALPKDIKSGKSVNILEMDGMGDITRRGISN